MAIRTSGLVDVHCVTDEDTASHSRYTVKIGVITNAARELKLKG